MVTSDVVDIQLKFKFLYEEQKIESFWFQLAWHVVLIFYHAYSVQKCNVKFKIQNGRSYNKLEMLFHDTLTTQEFMYTFLYADFFYFYAEILFGSSTL